MCSCPLQSLMLWFTSLKLSLLVPRWNHMLRVLHILLWSRKVRPGEGEWLAYGHVAGRAWNHSHSPFSQCTFFSTKMWALGRNALSEQGWKADVISPRDGESGEKGRQGVAGWGISPCPPPPRLAPVLTELPLQMMVFSANGSEAGLSLSLSRPATIVISCQEFLDGRGNVQVLMRWYSKISFHLEFDIKL